MGLRPGRRSSQFGFPLPGKTLGFPTFDSLVYQDVTPSITVTTLTLVVSNPSPLTVAGRSVDRFLTDFFEKNAHLCVSLTG